MAEKPPTLPPEVAKLHAEACAQNKDTYIDPKTGYLVFTEIALQKQGNCCGSGCRHCPWSGQT